MDNRESAQYSNNYVEYIVPMKNNSSLLLKKAGILALIAVLSVVGALFILNSPFLPVMVIYLVLVGILGWFLWQFVSIEFEYCIAMGEMDMDIIYGQRRRHRIASAKIKDMTIIAPYGEEYMNQINASDINKRIFAASDINSPDTYFCIYNDEKNGKTILIFEATVKTLGIMKFYNSKATVVSDRVTH
ncbi:MAG: hypothetical protein E7588_09645 [Ruminococcaceae bacterium]|nr:hypothetical protein [Oscillospiraceae bacterium]